MKKIRGFEPISKYEDKFLREGSTLYLPTRSTKHSAGYDFFIPTKTIIPSHLDKFIYNCNKDNKAVVKPTLIKLGVKAYMSYDEVLELYIRSSTPSKKGLIQANSVGIIDSDYYNNPENEGEIGLLVYNMTTDDVVLEEGEKICQGIFKKFLKADADYVTDERVGGYGSTGE